MASTQAVYEAVRRFAHSSLDGIAYSSAQRAVDLQTITDAAQDSTLWPLIQDWCPPLRVADHEPRAFDDNASIQELRRRLWTSDRCGSQGLRVMTAAPTRRGPLQLSWEGQCQWLARPNPNQLCRAHRFAIPSALGEEFKRVMDLFGQVDGWALPYAGAQISIDKVETEDLPPPSEPEDDSRAAQAMVLRGVIQYQLAGLRLIKGEDARHMEMAQQLIESLGEFLESMDRWLYGSSENAAETEQPMEVDWSQNGEEPASATGDKQRKRKAKQGVEGERALKKKRSE